ncbi:rRNA methyltransferase [Escovopsis weberi]|uniref:rRNA methyltransferase 1, mitochondrial n=1 Tax=Escovopsis weberi TaxID=150374 RepID=A0A0N0RTK8_ESCWE|nr:rRNA methyltransferase [Escovopsis weberi]
MAGIRNSLVQHLFSSSGTTSSSFNCQVRASSLSAIHRGVRRSQRVQDDEPISATLASKRRGAEWDRRGRLTAKALSGVSSPRQAQKLRKKLDRDQEDEGKSLRQTRRSRFLDPEKPFGKNSLVYQLKHGVLKDEVASLKLRRPAEPAPFRSLKPEKGQRLSQSSALEQAIWGKPAATSQFLYGKSVVKAALEQHRRKLYNLYIYAGDTRKDSKDDAAISSAAERRGVPVTMVPHGEQSMMDRMSMGRPHNGFVLEASPLQQPPITSLGGLEESLGRLGFHVELGYQSKEEEAVNGRETFVARKNDITAKPFVLFLNEILDPGNLGGLLRTASYLGIDAVVMTNRSSSTLTPVVLKSAAGAAEEVSIFTVDSPVDFVERSKKAGWKVYAAVAPPDSKLARMHEDKFISTDAVERRNPLSKDPCVLVLGNEGHGLSKPVKMAADYELSIPRHLA